MKAPFFVRLLALYAPLSAPLFAAPVFLEGVSEESGWYDVNKNSKWFTGGSPSSTVYDNGVTRDPQYTPASLSAYYNYSGDQFGGYRMYYSGDFSMCWAASAANTLQWWQDRKAEYTALPTDVPNGYSPTHLYPKLENVAQLAIYQNLYTHFSYQEAGVRMAGIPGKTFAGWDWWFNGYTPAVAQMGDAYGIAATDAGGYWKDEGLYTQLTQNGNAYTNESTLFSVGLVNKDDYVEQLTRPILNGQASSLTLQGSSDYSNGHAVTLWGFEQAEDGLYLYLTDSDDYYHGLVKYKLSTDGERVLLSTTDTHPEITLANGSPAFSTLNGLAVAEVYALKAPYQPGNSIPEPATTALGLLALAAFGSRRRRG